MLRPVSIFTRLLRSLVLIIVLLSAAILTVTILGSRRAVEALSATVVDHAIGETVSELEDFFQPIDRNLRIAQRLAESKLISPDDPEPARMMATALMRQYPQVSSVLIADERGHEIMTLRAAGGWRLRQTRRDVAGDRTTWLDWSDDQPEPVESTRHIDYDPRRRPWYIGAIERRDERGVDAVHWTAPYTFFTTGEPGVTASITFDTGGGREGVIAFDVLLRDISEFTTRLRVSEHGKAIVSTDDLRVIGLPRDERFESAEAREAALLKRTDELEMELATELTSKLRDMAPEERMPLREAKNGVVWWGAIEAFRLTPEDHLWISVIVPEADLLGEIKQLRTWILVLTLLALVIAITQAVRLARSYSRPIEALVAETDRISGGDLSPPEPIESDLPEVRRLARAHQRMREGLASLMALERDLQLARQIQQQTFPRNLPSLPGFEIEAWSSPAQATGGDSYDIIGYRRQAIINPAQTNLLTTERAQCAMFLLADATGHGIGPAISVTQVRAMLRMGVRNQLPLPRIARLINEQLCADFTDGRFVTVWLAELEVEQRRLTMFSGGQGPIFHYVASERSAREIGADTIPFGVMPDIEFQPRSPLRLHAGDIVAVMSDGIFEAENSDREQFGRDRVRALLEGHSSCSARELLETIRGEVRQFTGAVPPADDRTAIVIKCVRR